MIAALRVPEPADAFLLRGCCIAAARPEHAVLVCPRVPRRPSSVRACPSRRAAALDPLLNVFANGWVACNSGWMRLTQRTQWAWQGAEAWTQALVPGELQPPVLGRHVRAAAARCAAHPLLKFS
jgi:hypothetical protein